MSNLKAVFLLHYLDWKLISLHIKAKTRDKFKKCYDDIHPQILDALDVVVKLWGMV